MKYKSLRILLLCLFLSLIEVNSTCKKEVKQETHNCPSGQHWDDATQNCVDDSHECPQGQHWDNLTQNCIIDSIPRDSIFDITERLTFEQDSGIASLQDTIIRPEQIKLPTGETAADFLKQYDSIFYSHYGNVLQGGIEKFLQKNLFVSRVSTAGYYFINKMNFFYSKTGVDSPNQYGLAYVWGSRIWEKRLKNGQCSQFLHGLDCSGMLIRELNLAGLNVSYGERTKGLSQANIINSYLQQNSEYDNLKYEDQGSRYSPDLIEAGDIIYFPGHIGIALRNAYNNELYIYQSNGTDSLPSCNSNNSVGRGPRCVKFNEIKKWFKSYGVLKLKEIEEKDPERCTVSIYWGTRPVYSLEIQWTPSDSSDVPPFEYINNSNNTTATGCYSRWPYSGINFHIKKGTSIWVNRRIQFYDADCHPDQTSGTSFISNTYTCQ